MKTTKQIITVLLVFVIAVSVAFAKGTSEQTAEKKQIISLWCGWPALEDIFNRAKADYEAENPNVEVEISTMNLRDFEQKLAVSLPAGSGPDIFVTSDYIVPMYVNAGLVAAPPKNVSEFIEANFDPLVKSVNKFKGPNDKEPIIYGVPHIGIARVQYFNKDLMAEVGLDPEKPPMTWDDLFEAARKITKYDENGNIIRSGMSLRIFGGGSGIAEKFNIKLVQAGGSFFGRTADGGWKANYNSEAGVDALGFYLDALYKYKVDSFEAKHDTDAFVNNLTGFYDRELFPITVIHNTAPDIHFGTSSMPGKACCGTVYSTESYFVSKASKNVALAWDFILYMQREKYVKAFFVEQGWIPPRTDIDFSDIFAKYPEFKAAYEFPEGYKFLVYAPLVQGDEILTKFADKLVTAFKNPSLTGNRPAIRAFLDELAEETNEILAEGGILGEGDIVAPGDVIEAPANLKYDF